MKYRLSIRATSQIGQVLLEANYIDGTKRSRLPKVSVQLPDEFANEILKAHHLLECADEIVEELNK